jgi:hypothetical protein
MDRQVSLNHAAVPAVQVAGCCARVAWVTPGSALRLLVPGATAPASAPQAGRVRVHKGWPCSEVRSPQKLFRLARIRASVSCGLGPEPDVQGQSSTSYAFLGPLEVPGGAASARWRSDTG